MKEDKYSNVATFEERHMISVMTYLMSHGPSRKIDLYQGVSSNPRMPDKLDHLEGMGLISQELNASTRSTIVSLTEAGKTVANMFIQIDNHLRSIR